MPLYIYNSLHRRKELFIPQDPSAVKVYVCGPTVYARAHIGNARSAVVFDQLFRVLQQIYPVVRYVRNITDVDDKINDMAQKKNVPISVVTEETIRWYHEDMARLGVLPPTTEPRATEHIEDIIDMIGCLLAKEAAYVAQGHVLFRVSAFEAYGKLSRRSLDEVLAWARIEPALFKESPADFVLWKPSDDHQPGWMSPWGRGRPGWHIECSAMGNKHLGFPIDIHCGGRDLLFPHHENEIAQGECATGLPCALYWMHNGMLTVEGTKMSKSLDNVISVEDAFQHNQGEVVRYALLTTHYRQNLDWNEKLLMQSRQTLDRFYQIKALAESRSVDFKQLSPDDLNDNPILKALLDDLNTPKAFATLHRMARELNAHEFTLESFKPFYQGARLLGLFSQSGQDWFQREMAVKDEASQMIMTMIKERSSAKKMKDFATADGIRQHLLDQGILLEDHQDGTTTWRKLQS